MLENIIKKLKRAHLYFTDYTGYIIQKAEEEKWPGIKIKIKPDYNLFNELISFYITIENSGSDSRVYEIDYAQIPSKYQVKIKDSNLTITEKQDIQQIAELRTFYYARDKIVPKANEKGIKTEPSLECLNFRINIIEKYLNEKYL